MNSFFPIVIATAVACVLVTILTHLPFFKKLKNGKNIQKDRSTIIRDAKKKLAQDPHNISGLIPLADLYFTEKLWDLAFPLYETLVQLAPRKPQINLATAALRLGICGVKVKKPTEALKGLSIAHKTNQKSFEVNFYLGQAFYLNKQYEQATPFFKNALLINHEIPEIYQFLGLSLYQKGSYQESLQYLKHALDLDPENHELLFSIADAMYNSGKSDGALKILLHLRPDPTYGARASLIAGIIHTSHKQIDIAIQDYEIGLKHTETPLPIITEIRYNLATAYLSKNNISKALPFLHEINKTSPNYKDIELLIKKHQEMNENSYLKRYLLGGNSDFIALCRKMVTVYFNNAMVRIIGIDAKPDLVEIQTEIETPKWDDSIAFHFSRSRETTGELPIRDFYSRIQDLKVGRGIYLTAGSYSPEALKFTEGRSIHLIDKTNLLKIFAKVAKSKSFQV